MPYLHLDLAEAYASEAKRELATRLCHLYAEVMQTQLWRPNVGIAELGEENLFHVGADGLESITMVLVEIRRGRSLDQRLELGRRIVDICTEVLNVPKRTVLVEFTVHTGDEILPDGTVEARRFPNRMRPAPDVSVWRLPKRGPNCSRRNIPSAKFGGLKSSMQRARQDMQALLRFVENLTTASAG
jgi:phenylpyruvate tautomerase PptA (4-oxalocrotonate tautomerase family)